MEEGGGRGDEGEGESMREEDSVYQLCVTIMCINSVDQFSESTVCINSVHQFCVSNSV